MYSDALANEVSRFDPKLPIERAWTPPSSWYTTPEFQALERKTVFRRTWQPVARLAQLTEPGSYVSGCFAGEPWVVIRDADGTIRGLRNVCMHKGREVVTGSGITPKLTCGYHAWTYDLDGRLRTAPRMAGVEDFHREQLSLQPLRTEVWGPWVFVSWNPQAEPLSERLAPLTDRLDATGWERLKFAGQRSWDIACNWKVYVDNYLDGGYHIPYMHPTLDAQLDMSTYGTRTFGEFSIQSVAPNSTVDERIDFAATDRIGEQALYAWIYPNFTLNRYGPVLDTNYVLPMGPDRCKVVYEFFFLETEGEDAERFIAESMEQSDVTQLEDIEISESVQRGLESTAYDRGRYAPRVEMGEHHFHRLLHADYTEGLSP